MNNYSGGTRMPHKDNRMIYQSLPGDGYYDGAISTGDSIAHWSGVRVPSLKRKAAWKRFYKLFPHLKGMKTITGSSSSWSNEGSNYLNKSTIKLKKIKK